MTNIFGADSTKGSIIELLSQEWPLTAKKIYNRIAKKHNISITYQATHKALKELIEKNVLEKIKDGYLINKEWAKQLGEFSQKVEEELEGIHQKKEIKNITKIIFDNHANYINFTIDLMEEIAKKDGKLNITFHYRHVPYPNVLSTENILKIKKIMPRIKWKILSRTSTMLDIWHAKLWKKIGVQVKTGADIMADRMIVINDYIISAYDSQESCEAWDKVCSIKDISDFDFTDLMKDILNKKYTATITMFEDKEIANLLHR